MAQRPTIADLARAAGVSLATVDRVLNGRQPVREATALRVLEAATRIGYHATTLIKARLQQERPEYTLGVLLQKPEQAFYAELRAEVEAAAQAVSTARLRLLVEYLPSQTPALIADRLTAMGARVQAVALTAIDHHLVTEAVADLRGKGVPVVALLSDFAQGVRHSYLGLNNMRVGRTAAAMIAHGMKHAARGAQIAIFVGGHRWQGHELRETGFRSYFREHLPQMQVLDTLVNLDAPELTYEATLDLMVRRPGLRGLYCAGGGMEGVIDAVRDDGRQRGIEVVVNELTDATRRALADGLLALVIATPLKRISATLMPLMISAVQSGAAVAPAQVFLPMDLHLPESL